ncbi:MAG: hypothetical protein MZV70_76925 [Desulfobacterales bacterium]|nr:hypothetical protein [Desulfobacterales bacterium]
MSSADCNYMRGTIATCGGIAIDVNGWKAPNTMGKDVYLFHVTKTGLKPSGIPGDGYENTYWRPLSNGYGCAEHYLKGK